MSSELVEPVTQDSPKFLPDLHPMSLFLKSLSSSCPALPSPMASFRVQDVELTLPGDVGNGRWNDGVHLASILNVLSPSVVLDLLSALLMERRCLFVASSVSLLSLTVHAVAALIYPFRWQHIFLPIVPHGLLDYLQAPMPWIAGVPRHLLPFLAKMELEEAVVVNLDTGKIRLNEDARLAADQLPWREHMFERLYKVMESLDGSHGAHISNLSAPVQDPGSLVQPEMVANVLLASVLRDFFLRLLGSHRYFVDSLEDGQGPPSPVKGEGLMRTTSLARKSANDHGNRRRALQEGNLWFDHESFQRAHRSKRARRLLAGMRGSQIYEVFIRERLALAANGYINLEGDIFEADVKALMVNGDFSAIRLSLRLQTMPSQIASQLKALHGEMKSSKRANLKLLGSMRNSQPAEGAVCGGLARAVSLDSEPKGGRLHDLTSPLTPFSHKVGSASKSMGRAAAAMSSRVRKQANSLGGLVSNGLRTHSGPRSHFDVKSLSTVDYNSRSSDSDFGASEAWASGMGGTDPVETTPQWGQAHLSLRTRRSTNDDDASECSASSSPMCSLGGDAEASTFDCPFSIQQLNSASGPAPAGGATGSIMHSRNASASSTASAVSGKELGLAARDGSLVGPSLEALFDGALSWGEADTGTPQHGGSCRDSPLSPLSHHVNTNRDLVLSPDTTQQQDLMLIPGFEGGGLTAPGAALESEDPFVMLAASGNPSVTPSQPSIGGGSVSLLDL